MTRHVVMVRFDAATEQRIRRLQEELVTNGYLAAISEWPPHITVAAYEGADEERLLQWTEKYAARQSRFRLGLFSLGIMPPGGENTRTAVLCLNPAHSKKLVDFHYGFHEKLEDYCVGIGWYYSIRHDNLIMHSTIGKFDVASMQKVQEIVFASDVLVKRRLPLWSFTPIPCG